MSGTAHKYVSALQQAAEVIGVVGKEVRWIDDTSEDGRVKFAVKWRCESRAEAEELRDYMVSTFCPTRVVTEQPHTWGSIRMDLPSHPAVEPEIGFYERPKE